LKFSGWGLGDKEIVECCRWWGTHSASPLLSKFNPLAGPAKDDVEVHAEDTGVWVVFDSEVDMLVDSKTKVS